MQCAYCLSEMPDGTTVCAHCTRKQPMSVEQKRFWWAVAAAALVMLPVVGFAGWSAYDYYERSAAVERIVECAHLHGNKDIDASTVNMEIDDGITQTGKGWRAGAEYAALFWPGNAGSPTGVCFVTQQTLFSD